MIWLWRAALPIALPRRRLRCIWENQAEHDVLVFGRIHIVAQRVGRLPQLRLKAQRRPITVTAVCAVPL